MPNLRLYYKSDYKIRETFKTQGGETIDPRDYNFSFTFIAGKENTFTCSHTINGGANEWVNCEYDLENNAVLCVLDNHGLLPGLLKRELTIEEPDSSFPDNKLDYITFKAYEIELIDTADGDSLYDIYDEEIVVAIGKVNPIELAEILHESETKDDIIDADELNYLDSENGFGIVKTTWLNIKAKLKTYFDTLFEPKKAATDLYVTQAEKSTWNAKQEALSADVDYLTPTTASTSYEPKKGENDNYVTDDEKTVIENTSGENTGDETAESIIDKIGTDGQIKSDYLPSYVDDVIEGYYFEAAFYSDSAHTELITAEQGKIYVDIATNFSYRYSGSAYINISNPLDYSTNIETDKASTTKVSAIKTLYDWAVGKFVQLSQIVTSWSATTLDTNVPSEKLVKDSLNLKADISPANGSTSALRALFIARGATYNGDGTYTLNELILTESEIMRIFLAHTLLDSFTLNGMISSIHNIKTNYTPNLITYTSKYNADGFCIGNDVIRVITFAAIPGNGNRAWFSSMTTAFRFCGSLSKINVVCDVSSVNSFAASFYQLPAFANFEFYGVKANIAFPHSPLLSLASLQYLVTNRANGTSRITITVHPTVWAKLIDSINYPTWNALKVEAYDNQYIDFASA